jgi:predicted metal-dependent hydrolase
MNCKKIKDSIKFIYYGKFYISTKKFYENFIIETISNIIELYNIKYFQSDIIIKFESKQNKNKGFSYGGTWIQKNLLLLQAWNLPKELFDNFFNYIIVHEIFHLFVPSVFMHKIDKNNNCILNGCFSEGFVEFMTYKYNNNLEGIELWIKEYNKINDKSYKKHRFMYFYGLTYMNKLYQQNPEKIDNIIKNILFDKNKNKVNYYKIYYPESIIKYDKSLKKLFTKKCDHIRHVLTN